MLTRFVVAVIVLFAVSAQASMPTDGFTESVVITGLTQPTALAFLPGGRFLLTELGGQVLLVDGGTATPLITIPVCAPAPGTNFETGLLGIAIHPDFPADHRIYLYRTAATAGTCDPPFNRVNELVCFELVNDAIDPATLIVLLSGIRTDTGYQNGGGVRVGPDRLLYAGVGDAGLGDNGQPPGMSTNPYAQNLNELEGKMLRLNLDGSIPSDNPFVGQANKRGEIFAYGFRNPFRFGFDPATNRLWAGDVGEITVEELDVVVKGGNYGWPRCEGTLPPGCAQPGDVTPVFTYQHSGPGLVGHAVIGGAFASGGAFGAAGEYVFADFGDPQHGVAGAIYHAPLNATRDGLGTPTAVATDIEGPVDMAFGPDGALYYVAYLAGAVRRIASTGSPAACAGVADCATQLAAALPNPAFAASPAARRVAKRLGQLDKKVGAALAHTAGASGKKLNRQLAKVRRLLGNVLTTARNASAKSHLGVPLAPVEGAVSALLAILPT